jgi:hypothetical protein
MAQRFAATLQSDDPASTMTFILVPPKVMSALGPRKRLPVRVTINGYTYRSTNSVYGGKSYLPVRAEVRKAAKVAAGDRVTVTIERDEEPRTVDLPSDLGAALVDADLRDAFLRFSPSHQKEYVQWIEQAKRADTRATRIAKTVEATREKYGRTVRRA